MKITSIKQQVKRKDRYAVHVDGKYSFSLGELELINSGLRLGQELNKTELEELEDKAKLDKAYDRALGLVAIRQRSKWEITDYLKRKKYEQEEIENILNKLSRAGYVDDLAFATAWVNNRRLLKPISKRKLIQELRQKRVSSEIINQVLAADETIEAEVLHELVVKKRQQTKYKDDLKLMQYLSRQGYNYGDIKEAMQVESED
ncbi:MAG TPA: RecX family transcriptional regulator [Patescibacteria group bacterium]|nr:RecX family transcriptional regulator [Patescibacteria group bacterium]